MTMRLTIVGCGDAFGSGGRGNTCFWVETSDRVIAVDFGATALLGLKRAGLDPNRIDTIFLSHLHGDHFGGLPFLFLDSQFALARKAPLNIVGPPGTGERLKAAQEVFFPGSSTNKWNFPTKVVELPLRTKRKLAGLTVESIEVVHPSGAPSTGLRLEHGGRLLAYSGDTCWTDTLLDVADGADLFIVECYQPDGAPPYHLDFKTLAKNKPRLKCDRIMLTHMSAAMLRKTGSAARKGFLIAEDGLSLDV